MAETLIPKQEISPNQKRAVEIHDRMIQNGRQAISEIAGGRAGEAAVDFLREDEEAASKLLNYLKEQFLATVAKHFHELGDRVQDPLAPVANFKNSNFLGHPRNMSSWDYVARLAAAKLNGTFDYSRESSADPPGKETGQHRRAANLLLQDLGDYEPEEIPVREEDPEYVSSQQAAESLAQIEDAFGRVEAAIKQMLDSKTPISDELYYSLFDNLDNAAIETNRISDGIDPSQFGASKTIRDMESNRSYATSLQRRLQQTMSDAHQGML